MLFIHTCFLLCRWFLIRCRALLCPVYPISELTFPSVSLRMPKARNVYPTMSRESQRVLRKLITNSTSFAIVGSKLVGLRSDGLVEFCTFGIGITVNTFIPVA